MARVGARTSASPSAMTLPRQVTSVASQTTHAVAPYMYAKVGYDPIKDFEPITMTGMLPLTGKPHT